MTDSYQELHDLLRQCRQQLELNRNLGVEFIRKPQPTPAAEVRATPQQPAQPEATGSSAGGGGNRQGSPRPAARPAAQPRPKDSPNGKRQKTTQPAARKAEVRLSPDIPPEPTIPPDDIFKEFRHEVANCEKCGLCKTRNNVVFGEGDPSTDLMFVGEGPGADEDRTGRPFVGRAGVLLTKIIHNGMKLHRHKVFIGNIVKCRPPGNRVPTLGEMAECMPHLKEQIATIRPKVVVAMGATAVHGLLGKRVAITKFRGTLRDWEGVKLMPTFHPSYLLRNYTREARGAVWQDMKTVIQYLKEIGSPLVKDIEA